MFEEYNDLLEGKKPEITKSRKRYIFIVTLLTVILLGFLVIVGGNWIVSQLISGTTF